MTSKQERKRIEGRKAGEKKEGIHDGKVWHNDAG